MQNLSKVLSYITAAIGIVIILLGYNLYDYEISIWTNTHSYSVADVEFGGDYQTYIYEASNTIVDELNDVISVTGKMLDAQEAAINSMHKIGGMIVISIGLSVFGFGLVNISRTAESVSVHVAQQPPVQQTYIQQVKAVPTETPQVTYPSPMPQSASVHKQEEKATSAPQKAPPAPKEAVDTTPAKTANLAEHLNYALQYSTDDGMKRYLNGVLEKLSVAEQEELKLILSAPQAKLRAAINEYLNSKKEE